MAWCTSSGGDCCAPGDEARTCADGWEAVEINEPHCHTYTCCDPGSTVEFEFGTGRGSGNEDRDHCSTHADCDHGYYCDDTQNCWKCDSLSNSWCDTYDHGSCCLYPLLAHCPVEDWPPLMDLCGPSNALHTPTSEYEIGYLFEDDSWRPSAKQPRFFGRLSWLLGREIKPAEDPFDPKSYEALLVLDLGVARQSFPEVFDGGDAP